MAMFDVKRNFHVPIPDSLYRALHAEAKRRGQPATQFVRELLEQWEERFRVETLRAQIAEYASRVAGTKADLDPELEAAGIETWNAAAGKSRSRKPRRK
jgi:hypothetical protein